VTSRQRRRAVAGCSGLPGRVANPVYAAAGAALCGWRLVAGGITTPEEVLRVTKDQSIVASAEDSVALLAVNQ